MVADLSERAGTTYGVVLPHFGPGTSRRMLLDGARAAERAGYTCLWARDHVAYEPHPWEPSSSLFLEQYVSLAAVAAVTDTIALGAGATIPFRSPHHVAALARSLSVVAERPVNIGLGLGDYSREMAMSGVAEANIPARRRETLEQLRSLPLSTGDPAPLQLWWAGSGAPGRFDRRRASSQLARRATANLHPDRANGPARGTQWPIWVETPNCCVGSRRLRCAGGLFCRPHSSGRGWSLCPWRRVTVNGNRDHRCQPLAGLSAHRLRRPDQR